MKRMIKSPATQASRMVERNGKTVYSNGIESLRNPL
jgi:hypothetical protein